MRRRRAIGLALLPVAAWLPVARAERVPERAPGRLPDRVHYAQVAPRRLVFPADHGAHPAYRTEWWYVTGWAAAAGNRDAPLGFQITFFRARPEFDDANPSAFAPRQVLFAHAAIADPGRGRLLHAERAARAGMTLAGARVGDLHAWIDDWRLERDGARLRGEIAAPEFRLALAFQVRSAPLLQGADGVSRKGHRAHEASHYYSLPQLGVEGEIGIGADARRVSGTAWFDHEWSSAYLPPEAIGWDWLGANLDDGGALMLFRMRGRDGGTHYAGGTLRTADGREVRFGPGEVRFEPLTQWRSPRTGVVYPVSLRVTAGGRNWRIAPLMDDQELDARASTGTIYWEGAVRAYAGDGADAPPVGRGYLELTGYWKPMRL